MQKVITRNEFLRGLSKTYVCKKCKMNISDSSRPIQARVMGAVGIYCSRLCSGGRALRTTWSGESGTNRGFHVNLGSSPVFGIKSALIAQLD